MQKSIFICSSMSFYEEVVKIETKLLKKGFSVTIPVSAQIMKQKNDFDITHFKGGAITDKQKAGYIKTNFTNISKSDSILVINNTKKGITGYIGPNVLMEIGLAFYLGKEIYIWNEVEKNAPYYEELQALAVIYINQNIDSI